MTTQSGRVLILAISLGLVAGMSSAHVPVKKDPAKEAAIKASIPVCSGEGDCRVKWEAAQLWLVHNASYKLQTTTDVLLETYNPPGAVAGVTADDDYVGKLFGRVTKEPVGDGRYKIVADLFCLAKVRFGGQDECLTQDQTLDFNNTVGSVQSAAITGDGVGLCPMKVVERLKQRGFSDQAIREVCAN